MEFYAYDKNFKQMQLLARNVYDNRKCVIYSDSWHFSSSNFKEIVPQSYGEWVYDLVIYAYNQLTQ